MENFKYKKVLIVDDSEIDSFINKKLLTKTHFAKEIVDKLSAKAAIEYLTAESSKPEGLPEIIFLDIMMPMMDGFGFLQEYDKLPEEVKDKCKIIMLTSSDSFKDLDRANTNKHVHKFLNKPLSEKALEVIKF
ncbi:MAG: response regulator [Bacteroidetes bacterium]|nr:response regulator [Bacteroidota bacterium]